MLPRHQLNTPRDLKHEWLQLGMPPDDSGEVKFKGTSSLHYQRIHELKFKCQMNDCNICPSNGKNTQIECECWTTHKQSVNAGHWHFISSDTDQGRMSEGSVGISGSNSVPVLLQVSFLCHDPEGHVGPHGVDSGHFTGWEDLYLCLQCQCGSCALLWYLKYHPNKGITKVSNRPHRQCLLCMCVAFFFSGLPNNTGLDVTKIMAKVPCKEDVIFRNSSFRKAVSRYVRCYSQVSVNSPTEKHTFYRISDINVLCQTWVSLFNMPQGL